MGIGSFRNPDALTVRYRLNQADSLVTPTPMRCVNLPWLQRRRDLEGLALLGSPLREQDHVNLVHATGFDVRPDVHGGTATPRARCRALERAQSDPQAVVLVPRHVYHEDAGFG